MKQLLTLLLCLLPTLALADSVWIEDFTSPELKAKIAAGSTTVIVPSGGTEQNGPYVAIGKHNMIVHKTAEMIAQKLGDAVVVPVIAYVPEGNISPAEGHMRFAGTISVSEDTFARVLEDTARSLKAHGFKLICFIGDHGGNQKAQGAVAEKLSKEWQAEGVQVVAVADYYGKNGQEEWAKKVLPAVKDPSGHAGFFDTSELLATNPKAVRADYAKAKFDAKAEPTTGVKADGAKGTGAYGKQLLDLKVEAAITQIRYAKDHPSR